MVPLAGRLWSGLGAPSDAPVCNGLSGSEINPPFVQPFVPLVPLANVELVNANPMGPFVRVFGAAALFLYQMLCLLANGLSSRIGPIQDRTYQCTNE